MSRILETIFFSKRISESEFLNEQSIPILFYDSLHSRCFGILKSDVGSYKFGWQSTIAKPIIKEIVENIYTVGIDQYFSIIDFTSDAIVLTLNLFYNFYTTEFFDNRIFICTELEVLILDKFTYKIRQTIELPDYFEKIIFKDSKVKIICFGENVVEEKLK